MDLIRRASVALVGEDPLAPPEPVALDEATEADQIRESFAFFDVSGTGELDADEFKQMMTSKGDNPLSDQEMAELMVEIDADRNGKVSVDEVRLPRPRQFSCSPPSPLSGSSSPAPPLSLSLRSWPPRLRAR